MVRLRGFMFGQCANAAVLKLVCITARKFIIFHNRSFRKPASEWHPISKRLTKCT